MDEKKKQELEQKIVEAKAKASKAIEFKVRLAALKKEIQDFFDRPYDDEVEVMLEDADAEVNSAKSQLQWFIREEQEKLEREKAKREQEEKTTNAINYLISQGYILGKDFYINNAQETARLIALKKKSS